jgi:hypothetical protein
MMVLGYSVKNSLISLPIAAFTAAYTSFLYTMIIYFNDFKIPNYAKFEGVLAEDETDLNVQWSHFVKILIPRRPQEK